MLGILRHMMREQENVLARCYIYPAVLEQSLKTARRRKLGTQIYVSLIFAWVVLTIILDVDKESLWSFRPHEYFVWFFVVWGIIQMKLEQDRIQTLRLIQALRSEE